VDLSSLQDGLTDNPQGKISLLVSALHSSEDDMPKLQGVTNIILELANSASTLLFPLLTGESFQIVVWLTKQVKTLIQNAKDLENSPESDVRDLCRDTLHNIFRILSMATASARYLDQQQKDALDDFSFMSLLIKFCIDECDADEESEIAAAAIFCLFGISHIFPTAGENPVVCGLFLDPQASVLGQHFIRLVNRGGSIMSDEVLESGLTLCRKLMEFSLSNLQYEECFFYTNDIPVFLDIIIREVLDVPADSKIRIFYLELLSSIIQHPQYPKNGKYKQTEISEICVDISSNDESIYDQSCVTEATTVLDILNKVWL